MSDPSLSREPFTPPGTLRCSLCFELVRYEDCYVDSEGVKWDLCVACGESEVH